MTLPGRRELIMELKFSRVTGERPAVKWKMNSENNDQMLGLIDHRENGYDRIWRKNQNIGMKFF